MEASTILLCAWATSAILVGFNAWDLLCRRPQPSTADPNEAGELWVHVGTYRYPYTKLSGYDKLSPLYYNPNPDAAKRWAYPDANNRPIYPSDAAVRRRGVGHNGASLPLLEKEAHQ